MGAFALIRKDADPTLPDRLTATLRKRGFAAPRRIDTRDHILLLANKLITPTPNFFSDESGDFVAVTGTIFYRESFGLQALAHLLADAKSERIDETAFFGSYAVIVKTGLKLSLFGDGLGTYKIYHTADKAVWSSSFLASLSAVPQPRFDSQAVYEYVFHGATFGNGSLIEGLSVLGPENSMRLEPGFLAEPRETAIDIAITGEPLRLHTDRSLAVLRSRYRAMANSFGSHIETTLSGGYDSRLSLALLRAHGATPQLHLQGSARDPQGRAAKAIASGEGLRPLPERADIADAPTPESVAAAVNAQFWAFDGCPSGGVVGTGSDLAAQQTRHESGNLSLDCSGGLLFRNFLDLPPRAFTIRDLMPIFCGQITASATSASFSKPQFHKRIEQKIAAIFPHPWHELTRVQIEYLYPGFRSRYVYGPDISVANAFGPVVSAFHDLAIARAAIHVPIRFKNHGIYEAAMIAAVDPRLAAYPSSYGHDFLGRPPLSRQVRDWAAYLWPLPSRNFMKNIKIIGQSFEINDHFKDDYRKHYLPQGTPVMDHFFVRDALRDNVQINRLMTLELLAQHMGVTVP
ncbi:hypothetical protein [Govanella unica]|uniref:Asparagine synthase n=1 Tax=Govanella unica TaxID=2975056 RepID=A0A9X3Z6Y0_9PROT|nr:hypothetical protein [Govania unica]MDA5193591.1 hypothetical protein [Govania unica]